MGWMVSGASMNQIAEYEDVLLNFLHKYGRKFVKVLIVSNLLNKYIKLSKKLILLTNLFIQTNYSKFKTN